VDLGKTFDDRLVKKTADLVKQVFGFVELNANRGRLALNRR
jgi:hypothetical protein